MASNPLQGSDISMTIRGDSFNDLDNSDWIFVIYPSDDIESTTVITKDEAQKVSDNVYKITIPSDVSKNMKQGYQTTELKRNDGSSTTISKKINAFVLDVSASKNIEI